MTEQLVEYIFHSTAGFFPFFFLFFLQILHNLKLTALVYQISNGISNILS